MYGEELKGFFATRLALHCANKIEWRGDNKSLHFIIFFPFTVQFLPVHIAQSVPALLSSYPFPSLSS